MARLHNVLADVFARPGLPIAKRFGYLLDGALAAYGMNHAYIMMKDEQNCTLAFASKALVQIMGSGAETTTDWIVANASMLAVPDAQMSIHARLRDQTGARPGCFLAAPIEFDGRVHGTVELLGKTPRTTEFSQIELSTMRMISIYAAAPLVLLGQR